jgi:hypothetical protein
MWISLAGFAKLNPPARPRVDRTNPSDANAVATFDRWCSDSENFAAISATDALRAPLSLR